MNKVTKILAAAAVSGAAALGIATLARSGDGFSADEKATIRLVQEFQNCMATKTGPFTPEQTEKAAADVKEIIDAELAQIPADQRPPQELIDMVTAGMREQMLVQNACIEDTGLNVEETEAKMNAMVAKHGEEKVITALQTPAPKP